MSETNSARRSCGSIGQTSLLFQTYSTSTAAPTPAPTCSPLESPVSRTHAPGSSWAMTMTAHSGLKLCASLSMPSPVGSLLRMLLVSSDWRSTVCYLTWKRKATKQGRWYFRLVPSTPITGETGFGLWPTPTKQDGSNNGGPAQHRRNSLPLNAAVLASSVDMNSIIPDSENTDVRIAAGRESKMGSLNPQFVEYLMGFPTDWTKTD